MPISYAEQASLTCPECGHAFTAAIWLIVDASERPDLIERAREGTLHRVTCPQCGHTGDLDAPLLIFTPPDLDMARLPLLFAPAQQTSAQQDQEHATGLLARLRDALRDAWRDKWLEQVQVVPRPLLAVALADDSEAEMRRLAEGTGRAIERLCDEDPDTYRQLEEAAHELVEHLAGAQGLAPLREIARLLARAGDLGRHLWEFINADTWAESRRILEHHPELLSDDADALLGRLIDAVRRVGAQRAAPDENTQRLIRTLEQHRDLLRRCRQVGLDRAFTEIDGPSVPPEFQNDLRRAQEAEQRYLQTGNVAALDVSVAAWERILNHPAFEHANERFRVVAINGAGGVYLRRYRARRQLVDLNHALKLWEKAVALTPEGFPDRPVFLNNLAVSLRERYARTRDLEDLEQALAYHREAVALTSKGSPNRPMYLSNLANGLRRWYARTGDLRDLEEAIRYYREAVALTLETSPDRPMYLNNLAVGLRERYARTGDLGDLEEAIRYHQEAVALTPEGSSDRPGHLNNLANGLRERYARTGDLGDLEEAIRYHQEAVALTPEGFPDRPGYLNNLANGLSERYTRIGDLRDLEEAIRYYREAVVLTPEGSPDHLGYLNNLAVSLRERYARTGELKDLEEAIAHWQEAVALTPEGSPDWPGYLNNLAVGLHERYARTGDLKDLEEVIRYYREAVALTSEGSPDHLGYLNNLAVSLRERYARTGELKDLEEAIAHWQEAVALTPEGSLDRPMYLNSLANGLSERYARTGDLRDLEEAIRYHREAVALTPEASPDRPMYLNNLAGGLRDRYARTGNLDDLEAAIDHWQQAVGLSPQGSPNRPMYLSNLANGLRERYTRTGHLKDLEEAIRYIREAVALTLETSPDRPMYLSNLAVGLRERYARMGNLRDLEESIRYHQEAVALTPEASPDRPMYLNNLANGLSERYVRTDDLADLENARTRYRDACRQGLEVAPEVALAAARNWGAWALEREAWQEAAEAYEYGLKAIQALLEAQVGREAKTTWLREAQGIPQRAAYAQTRLGHHQQAVEILESGIARLLREALAQNSRDLERLRQTHPQVYGRYQQAREEVARLQAIASQERSPDWTEHLRRARQEVRNAVEAIRAVPGFEHFLRPLPWEEIAELARDTLLVYLLTTPAGGLALAVHKGNVTPVFLDALDEETVNAWLVERDDKGNVTGGYLPAQITGIGLSSTLENLLPRLGHALDLLWDHLSSLTPRPSPLTPIPTGRLALLPWHAAQHPTTGRAFLDDFAVAYAVSAHTLHHLHLQAGGEPPSSDGHLLAVGNPTEDLRYAALEARSLADLWPGQATLLLEDEAIQDAVWDALARAAVAHFATHGTFNPEEPLQSALLLAQGTRLTLRDLMEAGPETLAHLRLAVLSACQTAIPDFNNLPDEVIGLPAGFHQAGVPGVVGSLWPVDDVSTALLMVRFYEYWLGHGPEVDGPRPAAQALAGGQCWLRDLTYDELNTYLEHHRRLRDQARSESRMPYQLVAELRPKARLAVGEQRGQERPYAHPYYWAGFVYYGAHPTQKEVSP